MKIRVSSIVTFMHNCFVYCNIDCRISAKLLCTVLYTVLLRIYIKLAQSNTDSERNNNNNTACFVATKILTASDFQAEIFL